LRVKQICSAVKEKVVSNNAPLVDHHGSLRKSCGLAHSARPVDRVKTQTRLQRLAMTNLLSPVSSPARIFYLQTCSRCVPSEGQNSKLRNVKPNVNLWAMGHVYHGVCMVHLDHISRALNTVK
jgi:hypothetical protein